MIFTMCIKYIKNIDNLSIVTSFTVLYIKLPLSAVEISTLKHATFSCTLLTLESQHIGFSLFGFNGGALT